MFYLFVLGLDKLLGNIAKILVVFCFVYFISLSLFPLCSEVLSVQVHKKEANYKLTISLPQCKILDSNIS